MAEKNFNTRIINKHDTEANWEKAVNFIPMQGEIIVYDADEKYGYERMKIGDGKTLVSDLPFTTNTYVQSTPPVNAMIGSIWVDTSVISDVPAEEVPF